MKVALVRREFTLSKGGAESYAVALAHSLVELGCEVHIFAERFGLSPRYGITYHRVPNIRYRTFLKHLVFVRNVRKALSEDQFDVVAALSRIDCADVYRSGDPLFVHWLRRHEPTPTDRLLSILNPKQRSLLALEERIFCSARIRKYIALSVMDKKLMMRYYSVPERKIRVLYNGVDTDRFNPSLKEHRGSVRASLSISSDAPLILFVGMDFKRKNLGVLMDALALLPKEFRLLVVGSGKAKRYRQRAESLKISERVVFVGRVSDVERYYGAADVFCLPSLYDPFCNAVLEAMASGLCVVVSADTGASELIENGKEGLVLKSDSDAEGVARAILEAFERREEFGENAAETASKHTLISYAEEFLNLLKEAKSQS